MALLNISSGWWWSVIGLGLFVSLLLLSFWKANKDDQREQSQADDLDQFPPK